MLELPLQPLKSLLLPRPRPLFKNKHAGIYFLLGSILLRFALVALDKVSRIPFQTFIQEDDGYTNGHHPPPLFQVQRHSVEDVLEEGYIQNHKVKNHAESNGKNKPNIVPNWQRQ